MTRDQLVRELELQMAGSEAYGATAPVSQVLGAVIDRLRELTAESGENGDKPDQDRMLRATEVAQRLAVSTRTVYKSAAGWPFTRRLPSGSVRFSEAGLTRWLARQR